MNLPTDPILSSDGPAIVNPVVTSPVKVVGRGNHGKLAAFTQLYINFEHEERSNREHSKSEIDVAPQVHEEVLHDGAKAKSHLGGDRRGLPGHSRLCEGVHQVCSIFQF